MPANSVKQNIASWERAGYCMFQRGLILSPPNPSPYLHTDKLMLMAHEKKQAEMNRIPKKSTADSTFLIKIGATTLTLLFSLPCHGSAFKPYQC